jgi:subtilisin family serine protease
MLFLAPLLGLLATVTADPPTSYAAESTDTRAVVPGAYFVQLKSDTSISNSLHERSIDPHALFHKRAADAIDYDVRSEFKNPDLFYGLSITVIQNLTSGEIQDKLLELQDVTGVWPVYLVPHPSPVGTIKVNGTTKAFKAKASEEVPGGSYLPQILGDYDPATALKQADVDRVHALGIKGKGMKIGIIDTGVDYRHPALGGGFGPGFKIAGGYDFV